MSAQREIVGVQYLRGIAACAVVFDHTSAMAGLDKYFGQSLWGGWLEKGALGVDLFFMISGFIIAIVSLQKDSTAPGVGIAEFARRRAFRILPMMWLAILTYAALRTASGVAFEPLPYLRALAVWPVGDLEPNIIWTLRHEAIFYVLFAATFLSRAWLRPLIALWIAAPFLYVLVTGSSVPDPAVPDIWWSLSHPVNVEFGVGLAFGLIWTRWLHGRSIKIPYLAAIALLYFVAAVAVGNVLDLRADRVADTLITALMFAPLLALAIWGAGPPNRFALLLGNASFAIYLFHVHFISALLRVWSGALPQTQLAVVVITIAGLTIGAGVMIHLMFERPLQSRLSRWWTSRSLTRGQSTSGA
ncbi:acyltransferase [Phenylobacterium sp.]|uniref:acyltransferase family protein n=1 Tax=Phenylobacterium sp. TaxID=1871053 RepID=UPI00286AE004|nr:acyltransferase [Phenylobacterium sp.]